MAHTRGKITVAVTNTVAVQETRGQKIRSIVTASRYHRSKQPRARLFRANVPRTEATQYGNYTSKRLGAGVGLGGSDHLVCTRRQGDEGARAQRPDQLAVLRRDPRDLSAVVAAVRLSQIYGYAAKPGRQEYLLEPVSARQLAFSALAPRLSDRVRGRYSRCGGRPGRTQRLGAAVLELLQAAGAATRFWIRRLAGRHRRQSAFCRTALRSER